MSANGSIILERRAAPSADQRISSSVSVSPIRHFWPQSCHLSNMENKCIHQRFESGSHLGTLARDVVPSLALFCLWRWRWAPNCLIYSSGFVGCRRGDFSPLLPGDYFSLGIYLPARTNVNILATVWLVLPWRKFPFTEREKLPSTPLSVTVSKSVGFGIFYCKWHKLQWRWLSNYT